MRNFQRITTGLDVQPIVDCLDRLPDAWSFITQRQQFTGSPHKDTETIFLRGPYKLTPYFYQFDLGAYDYPVLDLMADALVPVLKPLLMDTLKVDELGRVLIVKLKPGGHVKAHIDQGAYADHYSRFHVALTTNDQCLQTAGDEVRHFAPGEAWWFNHKAEHTATNEGETERIHIIIDAVAPGYAPGKAPVSEKPEIKPATSEAPC